MKYFEGMVHGIDLPEGKNLYGRCMLKAYRHMCLKMMNCPYPMTSKLDRRDWFVASNSNLTGIQKFPLFVMDVENAAVIKDLVKLNDHFEQFTPMFEYVYVSDGEFDNPASTIKYINVYKVIIYFDD